LAVLHSSATPLSRRPLGGDEKGTSQESKVPSGALRDPFSVTAYVPLEAAKALVKSACSVCPKKELGQCRAAIDWVRGRREEGFTAFPVGFTFTRGVEGLGDKVSHIILLRRKDEGPGYPALLLPSPLARVGLQHTVACMAMPPICFGPLDRGAHAKIACARRSDTPMLQAHRKSH